MTMAAAQTGQTSNALPTAVTRSSISIAIRTGPGVAIPVVVLSPGVLNSAGRPTRTIKTSAAGHHDPTASATAQGPATHATISMPNLVADEATVSNGLTCLVLSGPEERFMTEPRVRHPCRRPLRTSCRGTRRGRAADDHSVGRLSDRDCSVAERLSISEKLVVRRTHIAHATATTGPSEIGTTGRANPLQNARSPGRSRLPVVRGPRSADERLGRRVLSKHRRHGLHRVTTEM